MQEFEKSTAMDVGLTIPGCCAIVVLCVLYVFYKKCLHANSKTRTFTACASPECVRCSRYAEVRRQAKEKLNEYTMHQSQDPCLYSRIKQAIEHPTEFTPEALQQPNVLYISDLKAVAWWENTLKGNPFSADIASLENKYEFILHEYKRISNKEDYQWSVNQTEKGKWGVFYFYNQGVRMNENCARCPYMYTSSLIDSLTNFMSGSLFGNASFSVLHSNTTITEHYGPCNIRIRCHLGKNNHTFCLT